jgi:hypothetical protein
MSLLEKFALLDYRVASSGTYLPTFWDKLSVPSSGVKKKDSLPLKMIRCPETSVNNYNYSLCDSLARPVLKYFAAED